MSERTVKVTYKKSAIGYSQRQKDTIRALGLRHLGDTIEKALTPAVAGMLAKVPHLVKVEDVQQ